MPNRLIILKLDDTTFCSHYICDGAVVAWAYVTEEDKHMSKHFEWYLCCLLGLHGVNVSHGYKQKWPYLGKGAVGNLSGVSGGK